MNRKHFIRLPLAIVGFSLAVTLAASAGHAEGLLPTHRIPAELASQAAAEVVASCAKQGYAETAVVVDADGVRQAVLRGDRAGSHSSMLNLSLGTGSPGSGLAPLFGSGGPRMFQGTLRFRF